MWKSRFAMVAVVLVGVAFGAAGVGPARAELDALMSCAKSGPCLQWSNSLTGDAIKGVSSKGNALHGQTKFASSGKTTGRAGVLGEDLSTSGTLNAGVSGISTNGAGVLGTSSTYNAVEGLSANSTGVYGQTASAGGFGVAGRNTATTHNDGGAAVLADGGPANDGIHAFANSGYNAVYSFSQNGSAIFANNGSSDSQPELVLQDTGNTLNNAIDIRGQSGEVFRVRNDGLATLTGSLSVNGRTAIAGPLSINGETDITGLAHITGRMWATGGSSGLLATSDSYTAGIFQNTAGNLSDVLYLISGGHTTNARVFEIGDSDSNIELSADDRGNLFLSGYLFSQGSCNNGCLQGDTQVRAVNAYAAAEAAPTIEDTGEATLVGGAASVPLDPKFANVIDDKKGYVVLLTPEGDCRGLFVAQRSSQGFVVRELGGGRSTIGFAYRIVASRFGSDAPRLPMTSLRHVNARLPRPLHH